MKDEQKDELAAKIAFMQGHAMYPDNYSEAMYTSAELYKEMTGKDLGIHRPKKVNRLKKFWQQLIHPHS